MSMTKHRNATVDRTGFLAAERAYLIAWGDEEGLEVSIKQAAGDPGQETAFVGYGEGVASWTIYRAEGGLWLSRIEERAGQGFESPKLRIESVEDGVARIIVDAEN
jgi:hypothetical protein